MSVWTWNPQERRLEEADSDADSPRLLAADSWFVSDGRVRALDRHRQRFSAAAIDLGIPDAGPDDFWDAVIERFPQTGEWFPRVEIVETPSAGSPMMGFRLRPSPKRTRDLRVLIPPYVDPRSTPHRKGPDIPALEELRGRARTEHSCDEVLLLNEDGVIIEAATTSLLWWDGETLCVPDPELGSLPGVTASVIVDETRRTSIEVVPRRVRPEDLNGHEVWLVNALHGIRRVTEFVDARSDSGPTVADRRRGAVEAGTRCQLDGADGRFERWRRWLGGVS